MQLNLSENIIYHVDKTIFSEHQQKKHKKKKTQKDPKNHPRLNHEIKKSKIGQRDTEESKKQKR